MRLKCEPKEAILTQALDELIDLLTLEAQPELSHDNTQVFLGQCQDLGFLSLFGGQVLGQSLSAANRTLPEGDWVPHSLHSYFLRAGVVSEPISYEVELLRDGRSFCARRILAKQNGKAILTMSCSFQTPEQGFEHQDLMPETKGPEGVPSQLDLTRMFKDFLPKDKAHIYTADKPIEIREVDPVNFLKPEKKEPWKHMWLRTYGEVKSDSQTTHAELLAYASDFSFIPTALRPHGVTYMTKGMQLASLDHSIWFHRPFRMDEWLLYAIDSPSASGGRGLVRGQLFNQQGELVASLAQEGVMRMREKPAK